MSEKVLDIFGQFLFLFDPLTVGVGGFQEIVAALSIGPTALHFTNNYIILIILMHG